LEFLARKFSHPEDRARISEVASQVSLVEATLENTNYARAPDYFFTGSSGASYNIHLNEDESVTVTSSITFPMKDSETTAAIPGLHLAASIETRIGTTNGRLTHEALADEERKGHYTLSFEMTQTSHSPSSESKKGFFNRFFNHAGKQ
jgi:hypothetical protein